MKSAADGENGHKMDAKSVKGVNPSKPKKQDVIRVGPGNAEPIGVRANGSKTSGQPDVSSSTIPDPNKREGKETLQTADVVHGEKEKSIKIPEMIREEPVSDDEESASGGESKEKKEDEPSKNTLIKFKDKLKGIFSSPHSEKEISLPLKRPKAPRKDRDELGDNYELIRVMDLDKGVLKVEVFLNHETSEYLYHPVEPSLAPRQEEVYGFIKEILGNVLSYEKEAMETTDQKEKFLDDEIKMVMRDYGPSIGNVTEEFMEPIIYYLKREFIGYGKINSIMMDVGVEDVSCDGTGIPVFVYHRDYGSIRTSIKFDTDVELEGFVVSLAQRAGKSITVATPILDATLPEGHRLNATFGREVTTRGSSFTIRKFKEDPLTIVDLVNFNTLSPEMAAHMWMAVQYGESIIFAGGTASGKTSTMNAVSLFIPPSAKIISIEDTREVNLPHQNWIAGITRGGADSEKASDIGMYKLLRAALRQRPEYVIVGEVRGKETMTMFQAMSTGHTTYSTMHADSVKSIVYRLENPPISIPRVLIQALNLVAIHNQLTVDEMRVRRITELVEIVGIEPTSLEIITNKVYGWEAAGDHFKYGGHSNLYEKIMDLEDMTRDEVVMELNRRAEIILWMVKNKVRQYVDVNKVIAEYYEKPDKVMNLIRENPSIDMSKGLRIFDSEVIQGLPSVARESLPSIIRRKQVSGEKSGKEAEEGA
mgnify:CR=1 FL=1